MKIFLLFKWAAVDFCWIQVLFELLVFTEFWLIERLMFFSRNGFWDTDDFVDKIEFTHWKTFKSLLLSLDRFRTLQGTKIIRLRTMSQFIKTKKKLSVSNGISCWLKIFSIIFNIIQFCWSFVSAVINKSVMVEKRIPLRDKSVNLIENERLCSAVSIKNLFLGLIRFDYVCYWSL